MSAFAYLDAALAGDRAEPLCALRREMAGAGLTAKAFARVLELGVPARALAQLCGAGDLAAARVSLCRPTAALLEARGSRVQLFEPEGPDARLLVLVREQGIPVDIVALATHDPDQWALRRGDGWCLGYDAWLACETGGAFELRVHATPLAWLRSGCEGVAILEWNTGLRMLRGLGEGVLLRCDRGAGERLKALLSVGNLPRVKETGGFPARPTAALREANGDRRAA